MTEYIDKAKAIEEIENFKGSVTRDSSAEWDSGVDEGFDYAVSVVELMEAADVTPVKRGKWLIGGKCSECNGNAPFYPMASVYYESKYCPHCGAKMDGEEE